MKTAKAMVAAGVMAAAMMGGVVSASADDGIPPVKSASPVGPGITWTEIHCKHPGFRHPVCYTVLRSKHPGIRSGGLQPVKTSVQASESVPSAAVVTAQAFGLRRVSAVMSAVAR